MLKSVKFRNFKTLREFSISLREMNVLVGPNNSGKSTILDGFRALAPALKIAKRRKALPIVGPNNIQTMGYHVPETQLPISTTNIHSDYQEAETTISFSLSSGESLNLFFNEDRRCVFYTTEKKSRTLTPKAFRSKFPLDIAIVPTLGPFEEDESYLSDDYVENYAFSRRGHRMFRNFWHRRRDEFDAFRELVETTWPGMSIDEPEVIYDPKPKLLMFCNENRRPREIYWSGFGFQIWLQILTHIQAARSASTIIIDEPDIYLHPELQHRLFSLLKSTGKQILIATHSVEIINEADQDEVAIIDKSRKSAKRANDIATLQEAIFNIGSTQNIHLERLSRGRKILFVEGQDFKMIKRFASVLGNHNLSQDVSITVVQIGGFSQWKRVEDAAWTFEKILEADIRMAALFDRDYRCDDEVEEFLEKIRTTVPLCYVLQRKEIENYLLCSPAIAKAIVEMMRNRGMETPPSGEILDYTNCQIDDIANELKSNILGQISANRVRFYSGKTKKDDSTLVSEGVIMLEEMWKSKENKLCIAPGKQILAKLNQRTRDRYGVSLTTTSIIRHMRSNDIPDDLKDAIRQFDQLAQIH